MCFMANLFVLCERQNRIGFTINCIQESSRYIIGIQYFEMSDSYRFYSSVATAKEVDKSEHEAHAERTAQVVKDISVSESRDTNTLLFHLLSHTVVL